ncbi:MAG TPA: autotransporter assembly complex family protein [Caulobacteraceae bacterium]
MGRLRLGTAAAVLAVAAGLAGRALADEPRVDIQGVQDKSLRQAIESYIGTSKRAPHSRFEARQRAQDAADDAVVVLRSEGYYDYTVTPDVTEGDKPRPLLRIEPGPRSIISSPQVVWTGPAPDPVAQTHARNALGLKPSEPGRAADVIAAEGRLIAALRKDGYADAKADTREVVVDHTDHTVRPTYRIDAKAKVHLDGLQVKSAGRTNPRWVASLAPWRSGQVYTPEVVAELQRRLLDAGVYNAVDVALSPAANADGLRPIIVSLTDRPRSSLALGGSYATREGFAADAVYSIFNLLGRADTVTFNGQYGAILKRIDGQISFPEWPWPLYTLQLGATAYRDDTTAYTERDFGVHADLLRRFTATSFRTIGISADYIDDDEEILSGGQAVAAQQKLALLTLLGRLTLDHSNDPLDPTRGWKFDGSIQPTVGTGDATLAYAKIDAQVSAYLPFGGSTVLAGRLHLGSIVSGGSTFDIPAGRRFFAGGGGSVRGYAYQAVGPRFPDNPPIGGLSLVEASAELRQTIHGPLGAVVFVDAGSVGTQQYPDFHSLSVGAGVGVRYNLGFAPLRVDVGFPLNPRQGDGAFQVYVSIGQSF